MTSQTRRSIIALPLVVGLGALLALAVGRGGAELAGQPLFTLGVTAAFIVQWIAFIIAFAMQTERFYDLVGSLTYVGVTIALLALLPDADARTWVLGVMVIAWAARLGPFLFARAMRFGHDDRFAQITPSPARFLLVWTVQGLWITGTAMAAWGAMTSGHRVGLDAWLVVGALLWAVGLAIETLADVQKWRFKADPANRGRFIRTGVWAWSRHPNYFGEIVLWLGVAIAAAPALRGWQLVALVSPLLVTLLLTRVSGIPLLEQKANRRWGDDPEYLAYRESTPVLIPRPPRNG